MLSLNELGYAVAVHGKVAQVKTLSYRWYYHTISLMKKVKK